MQKQLKADLALLSVVIVWGSTFVLTKDAIQHIETYNFLMLRFGIAVLMLLLFSIKTARPGPGYDKNGAILGLLLFIGYAFQTVGLNYTTASTGLYHRFSAVIVPILSAIMLKKKPQL